MASSPAPSMPTHSQVRHLALHGLSVWAETGRALIAHLLKLLDIRKPHSPVYVVVRYLRAPGRLLLVIFASSLRSW